MSAGETTDENEGSVDVDGALSRKYLLSRGKCCGNGCKNCPWRKSDDRVDSERR